MGHWYTKEGKANHFAGPNGKGTTLREARKLHLFPSVTTIGNIVAAPGLVRWLQREVIKETLVDVMGEHVHSDDDRVTPMVYGSGNFRPIDNTYCEEIISRVRAKTMALADAGTEIHDALELHYGAETQAPIEFEFMCLCVSELLYSRTGILWNNAITEKSFTDTELGYAGKCDLHAYTTKSPDGDDWVIDYKSKPGNVSKERGWPNQAEQLAAYAHGLGIPNARTANVFISRDRSLWGKPEGVSFFEHKDANAWNRFEQTLRLWSVTKKYGPYYDSLIKEGR